MAVVYVVFFLVLTLGLVAYALFAVKVTRDRLDQIEATREKAEGLAWGGGYLATPPLSDEQKAELERRWREQSTGPPFVLNDEMAVIDPSPQGFTEWVSKVERPDDSMLVKTKWAEQYDTPVRREVEPRMVDGTQQGWWVGPWEFCDVADVLRVTFADREPVVMELAGQMVVECMDPGCELWSRPEGWFVHYHPPSKNVG